MSRRAKSGSDRAREVLALFQKGADFTRELLEENGRLRRRLAALEEQQRAGDDGDARERLRQVEQENRQFAARYLEIEEENNNLANLYVASYQLHSTLDLPEVLKAVVEIAINLIGAEEFAVYVLDERSGRLEAVAGEGRSSSEFPSCVLGEGVVGRTVASGETWWRADASGDDETAASDPTPLVCVPLRVKERPIGAIAIHRLLDHKRGFSDLDRELVTLLGGHAATALCAARLFAESERKLHTIQGFLELLTG